MGATAYVKSISPQVLAILVEAPSLIEPFVCCYPPSVPQDFPEEMRVQFLSSSGIQEHLMGMREWLKDESPEHAGMLLSEASEPHVYLDKVWHQLQEYIRDAGAASSAATCILGGQEIGPDLGYGRARLLLPAEVVVCTDDLLEIDGTGLPSEELRVLFAQLQGYYREASEHGRAILQHLE